MKKGLLVLTIVFIVTLVLSGMLFAPPKKAPQPTASPSGT